MIGIFQIRRIFCKVLPLADIKKTIFIDNNIFKIQVGDVAQTVERSLCMREARGSIPRISIIRLSCFS